MPHTVHSGVKSFCSKLVEQVEVEIIKKTQIFTRFSFVDGFVNLFELLQFSKF